MKRIFSFLITIALALTISTINISAQTEGTQSKQSTANMKGLSELKKLDKRNKKAEARERAAEKREAARIKKAEKAREKKANAKEKKESTKTASTKTKSSRSKKSSSGASTASSGSARPIVGPVDVSSHKKIVNGHEVTVIEMEPKKK